MTEFFVHFVIVHPDGLQGKALRGNPESGMMGGFHNPVKVCHPTIPTLSSPTFPGFLIPIWRQARGEAPLRLAHGVRIGKSGWEYLGGWC